MVQQLNDSVIVFAFLTGDNVLRKLPKSLMEGFTMLNQQIGQRIAETRKAKQLTQEQLGEKLGVSAQAVSKWEKGESLPDICLLPELSKELGLSIDTLLSIPATDTRDRLLERLSQSMDTWDLDFMWQAWSAMYTGAASIHYGLHQDGINSVVSNHRAVILDGLGLGAIFAKEYVSALKEVDTSEFSRLLSTLSKKETLSILLRLSPIKRLSNDELQGTLSISTDELRERMLELMACRLVTLDEEGYRLSSETWPFLLLVIGGVFLWSGIKRRGYSYCNSFAPEEG
jgi:transcriptional regulator with XRE-family HTH domain